MIAGELPALELQAAERRRILAKVYSLLISLAEEMEEPEDLSPKRDAPDECAIVTAISPIGLLTSPENSEQKELPAPLKLNSPP